MKLQIAVIFVLFSLSSCGADPSAENDTVAAATDLAALAREYLFLELSMGGRDNRLCQ